jgi:hypothetical protein
MKYYKYLLTQLLILSSLAGLLGQTNKKTLNYQAVILDPKAIDIPGASITGQPLNKGNVCLRFSLLNAQGGLDYEETQQVTTDEFGLVSVSIGTGTQAQASNSTSIYKSFESILWNASVKSLKVSVSYDGCSSFKQVSTQSFNYTPYALYAESVEYKNVREAPTKLSQFSNDAGYLIPKDLDPLKADIISNTSQLATANQTIADNKKSSDAAFLIVNQSVTSLDTQVAANTTALKETSSSIGTINTKLSDQQNQITTTNNTMNAQIGGLQGQINTTNNTVSNLTGVAEVVSNKSTSVNLGGANPSDQLYPSQKAAKSYIDNAIYDAVGSGVPDATTLAAGKVKLAGDLGGTAASPTVPALANKENITNKSTATDLGAGNPSDQLYPSQKATKAYVDNSIYQAVGSGVPDATTNAAGKLKLAGDLAGTASNPTVPGLTSKEDVSNKSNSTSLGTSTTAYPTQHAVKAYVDAQISNATIADANSATKGKIKLAGALGGTADAPTVPGLVLKEDVANKSAAADLGAGSTSDDKYPSQKAVKTYVDNQVASANIADASATIKGKLQLAGDLAGTNSSSSAPVISNNAINSAKIEDRSIATDDIADLAITNGKIDGVAGSKVSGDIAGNAANVTGLIAVSNGGTGASNLTGYVKGNGTSAMTTVSSIPVSDVTGAVKKVNGTLPNASGEVQIFFGRVSTGTYDNRPTFSQTNQTNGDIYVVSGDNTSSHNGRTFIRDDNAWNEVAPNTAASDARYLQLGGGVMEGNISVPTGKKVTLTDAPSGSTDAANKNYVDTKIASEVPYASTTVVGKIQLAGDLGGTYLLPSVPGLADKAPKNNPAFTGTVTGITKTMVDLANVDNTSDANKPVSTATLTALNAKAPIASPSFTGTATFEDVSGISKSEVGLGSVDNTSDLAKPISTSTQTALDAKENATNKSNDANLGESATLYPSQYAVKTYVDAQVTSGAPDANVSTKGKIQLAGDLTGTAALPEIASGAITSAKISDGTIATIDIADLAVTDAKIGGVAGSKVSGNILGNAANVTGTVAVTNGGTGATSLTGIVKGNGTSAMTNAIATDFPTLNQSTTGNAATATKLAASKTINGVDFDGSANITVTADATTLTGSALKSSVLSSSLTSVGTLTDLTVTNPISGSITGNAANVTGTVAVTNGGTGATTLTGYVKGSGTSVLTASANIPVADVTGAQTVANLSTDISLDAASTTKYPAVKTIKEYVDASVTSGAPNATTSATGKIQLAGDLAGTNSSATAPFISADAITTVKIINNAVTSDKIKDGEIVNADISTTAAIADSKLATISTSGKVSNSATTATSANTASTIVLRDLNGNFNAGTITASLTGLASLATNLNGGTVGAIPYQSAANTTTLLTGNTAATKKFLTQTGDGSAATAPVWAGVAVSDITGTLPVANGGTGAATATQNYIFAGPATGSTAAAPGFRAIVAADIPASAISYAKMQNISTGKLLGSISGSAAAPGEVTVGTGLSLTNGSLVATNGGTVTSLSGITFGTTGTDMNANIASASTTPSITLNIPDASATARGVVTTGAQTIAGAKTFSGNTAIGGTLNVTGVTTLTAAPVLSSTTASQALFTDASKNVVSKAVTGTGDVVLKDSPSFSGTVTFPTATVSGAITAKNYVTTVPAATTAAATTSIDFSTGNIFKLSLGTNITTLSISNAVAGTYLLEIIQGGTYTVTFPAAWKWSGGSAPTITATSGKTDIITIVYDGTTYFASAVQNF